MKKSDFHFDLPPALIAQVPLPERSASRLLLVPPGDVDAMAGAIKRLLTDTELRRSLAQAALRKVETFTPASSNQRMLELALSILRKQDAPGVQTPR